MGGRGVREGAVRGVLWVRRGFQEVAGFLGVAGVVEEIFLVGGRRGDLGGIGGAGLDAEVITKGCGVKVRKIAPEGFLWVLRGSSVFGSVDGLLRGGGQWVQWIPWGSMGKRQRLDSRPKRKLFFCYVWPG